MLTGAQYRTDPVQTMLRYGFGGLSPALGIAVEFTTGRTYQGEPVDIRWGRQWQERFVPLSIWDMLEAYYDEGLQGLAVVAIPTMTGYGVTSTELAKWHKDFEDYQAIPSSPLEAREKGFSSREEYRERFPKVDAKLFLVGETTTIKSLDAANWAVQFAEEDLGWSPLLVPGVKQRIKQYEERVKLGLPILDKPTPTDYLVGYFIQQDLERRWSIVPPELKEAMEIQPKPETLPKGFEGQKELPTRLEELFRR